MDLATFSRAAEWVKAAEAEWLATRPRDASAFNVLEALGVGRREVPVCALLTSLLDPHGDHDCGAFLLEPFLKLVAQNWPNEAGNVLGTLRSIDDWVVSREVRVPCHDANLSEEEGREGRIDIILCHPPTGVLIAVEAKLGAGEQSRQLDRYSEWMSARKSAWSHRPLVFLTPKDSRLPNGDDLKPICLNYEEHLVPLLQQAVSRSALPDKVASIVTDLWRCLNRPLPNKERSVSPSRDGGLDLPVEQLAASGHARSALKIAGYRQCRRRLPEGHPMKRPPADILPDELDAAIFDSRVAIRRAAKKRLFEQLRAKVIETLAPGVGQAGSSADIATLAVRDTQGDFLCFPIELPNRPDVRLEVCWEENVYHRVLKSSRTDLSKNSWVEGQAYWWNYSGPALARASRALAPEGIEPIDVPIAAYDTHQRLIQTCAGHIASDYRALL